MTAPSTPANEVRDLLHKLVAKMNEALEDGIKIEWQVGTDPMTGKTSVVRFDAFQRLKLDN